MVKDATDMGKNGQLLNFTGSLVNIRRRDGALATMTTSSHASKNSKNLNQ
jgi:hypothetical protein